MRGKVHFLKHKQLLTRITPAYAGKSTNLLISVSCHEDHPRLCGEKLSDFSIIANVLGSPPPMRGKVIFHFHFLRFCGITPAYAGKSIDRIEFFFRVRDHPRLCGEKATITRSRSLTMGSPPPMRGKDSDETRKFCDLRITPAYAGKRP